MWNAEGVSIRRLTVLTCNAAVVMALAAPAAAQNEDALKAFFEGRRVVTRIDLPGTSDGVDVKADAGRGIDYAQYGNRLKTYGTAIRAGDQPIVTLIKVKKDLIEFQLDGGGYGTFGDDTSTSVHIPSVEKSSREKELEKRVKDETDSRRRRELEDELDQLRERRERENRRIEVERVRAEELKRQRIADRRLQGGSRFNIRYPDVVPSAIRPEEVMATLAEYVDFPGLGPRAIEPRPAAALQAPPAGDLMPRKGMLRADVEAMFGPARQSSDRREGNLIVTTLVFLRGDQRMSAEFVEDVLVRYTITSK